MERKHIRPKPLEREVDVKTTDDIVRGVYANAMRVSHTKEEFVLDFMNLFPDVSTLNARVIVSPAHMKRIVAALEDNIRKYEARSGAPDPEAGTDLG